MTFQASAQRRRHSCRCSNHHFALQWSCSQPLDGPWRWFLHDNLQEGRGKVLLFECQGSSSPQSQQYNVRQLKPLLYHRYFYQSQNGCRGTLKGYWKSIFLFYRWGSYCSSGRNQRILWSKRKVWKLKHPNDATGGTCGKNVQGRYQDHTILCTGY